MSTMTMRIARREFLELVRDGRFRVLAVLVLALSTVAFAAGWKQYVDVERQHVQAQQGTREQWLRQPAKNPHSAAHYGMYAFKPKSRLSLIDTGIDPYVGVAAWLEAHRQNEFRYRPAQDRTEIQRFSELTAAESFVVIVPLFIVLSCFSAFAGEREIGTLRQLLSLGIAPRELFAGKALGATAALALVVVPATTLGVVGLAATSEFEGLRADLPRAAAMALVYLAYFATVVAISLGVSARARTARTALVLLLALWFANSVVVTRAASDLAAWLHPTPSAIEFQSAMQADLSDQKELQQRVQERRQELLSRYGATSMEAIPVGFQGISLQEGENHGNEVFDHHFGRLFDTYASQNRVYQLAGVAAPIVATRSLSMGFAGTDFAHHREFVRSAEEYRRAVQRTLNDDIARNARPGVAYVAAPSLWAAIPEFSFRMPGIEWAVAHTLPSVVLLLSWLAGSLWFAVRSTAHLTAD
jgi:ABC-2 type transport system permease protein